MRTNQVKTGDHIIVTDGSSDGHTGEVIAVLAGNPPRVRIKRDDDGAEVTVANYSLLPEAGKDD